MRHVLQDGRNPQNFWRHHTRPRLVVLPGPEDDLAAGVAAFELDVGLADLRQRVDVRDRHLKVSVGDQAGQLGEHLGARPAAVRLSVFTPCFWAVA